MILTKKDLDILDCFAHINPSIQFKKGTVQKTVSTTKSILAKAELSSECERDFAIYDLHRFLKVLNLDIVGTVNVELMDQYAIITNDKNPLSSKYYYCAPNTIFSINQLTTQEDLVLPSVEAEFSLPWTVYEKMSKSIGIFGVNSILISGLDGKLAIETFDVNRRINDGMRLDLGETEKTFRCVISQDNLYKKLFKADYTVSVSEAFSKFQGVTEKVTYWIAPTNEG